MIRAFDSWNLYSRVHLDSEYIDIYIHVFQHRRGAIARAVQDILRISRECRSRMQCTPCLSNILEIYIARTAWYNCQAVILVSTKVTCLLLVRLTVD